jgi:hypothetical protein
VCQNHCFLSVDAGGNLQVSNDDLLAYLQVQRNGLLRQAREEAQRVHGQSAGQVRPDGAYRGPGQQMQALRQGPPGGPWGHSELPHVAMNMNGRRPLPGPALAAQLEMGSWYLQRDPDHPRNGYSPSVGSFLRDQRAGPLMPAVNGTSREPPGQIGQVLEPFVTSLSASGVDRALSRDGISEQATAGDSTPHAEPEAGAAGDLSAEEQASDNPPANR